MTDSLGRAFHSADRCSHDAFLGSQRLHVINQRDSRCHMPSSLAVARELACDCCNTQATRLSQDLRVTSARTPLVNTRTKLIDTGFAHVRASSCPHTLPEPVTTLHRKHPKS